MEPFKPMPSDEAELLPLVNFSYDLAGTLKAEEIPNPAEFVEDVKHIMG